MSVGWGRSAVVVMACLALVACGAGDDRAAPTPTATPALPTAPATPAGIGGIVWTAAVDPVTNAPTATLAALPDDAPQVVAALPVALLPAGTVLRAQWTIDGDPLPALAPEPVTVGEGRAGAWVTWTLRWRGEQPWPIGRLGIVVEIDGAVRQRADIPIVRAHG